MTTKKLTNTQQLNNLTDEVLTVKNDVLAIRVALEGDEAMGIKGPLPRLFDLIEALPCNQHNARLDKLETGRAVNNELSKQRNKWIDRLIKIGLPVGAGGGLVAWLEKLFG